ncbi:hypothetical protein B0H66DRAFT_558035 [Apodospora peruviana]|uniref:Uncharacterized protein n=1 Tax=Apodospora peruviana TaxID=516989 RepID=A0AAE0M4F9_9PEZI|nr:hypothetical protein B0H66DRAFT_558035 [Apodospora peruviana]
MSACVRRRGRGAQAAFSLVGQPSWSSAAARTATSEDLTAADMRCVFDFFVWHGQAYVPAMTRILPADLVSEAEPRFVQGVVIRCPASINLDLEDKSRTMAGRVDHLHPINMLRGTLGVGKIGGEAGTSWMMAKMEADPARNGGRSDDDDDDNDQPHRGKRRRLATGRAALSQSDSSGSGSDVSMPAPAHTLPASEFDDQVIQRMSMVEKDCRGKITFSRPQVG